MLVVDAQQAEESIDGIITNILLICRADGGHLLFQQFESNEHMKSQFSFDIMEYQMVDWPQWFDGYNTPVECRMVEEMVQVRYRFGHMQMAIQRHICYFLESTQSVDDEWMKADETSKINLGTQTTKQIICITILCVHVASM